MISPCPGGWKSLGSLPSTMAADSNETGGSTPMMRQYQTMRHSLPSDIILMYRLGDFYEMFFDDAKVAAGILGLALTKRNGIPMCGVPHHSSAGYLAKLIQAGKRVAIAEQTSDPKPGKLVEREISQIISAGTVDDSALLPSGRPNYLAAVFRAGTRIGIASVEHSTGEFRLTEVDDRGQCEDELERLHPAEMLHSDEQTQEFGGLPAAQGHDGYAFLYDQAYHTLKAHFKVQSLDGYGCADLRAAVCAAGAILHYLESQMRRGVGHIRQMRAYRVDAHVLIDSSSQRNLDLLNSRSGVKHSLLGAIDRTVTPMGARRLRDWVAHPLRDLEVLTERQEVIAALIREPGVLTRLRDRLGEVRDMERTLSRLSQGSGNGRELRALVQSLLQIPEVKDCLSRLPRGAAILERAPERLGDFTELTALLDRALVDEPPATLKEAGLFRDGYHSDIDDLRNASTLGRQWIADLQTREQDRTGIKSLKVRYNAVFGYFIEITRSNLANVPDDYTRKQTTVNSERFITPELKEVENKILGADERLKALEYEEFQNLRETVLEHLGPIQEAAAAIADLDALSGLAELALLYNYCRPLLNESRNLYIRDGRHPVLDQNIAEEKFVPNDTVLEPGKDRVLLITGPNMAGKSTYIRQVALITLMAQIGSYVPAAEVEIGLVDRIFTRVGANDDLSRGQSTFMVEMNETALIVNNATDRSLVILDEIGRGTSTFDGLSIAWSVAEHLHDRIQARTLFATHYHELTRLADSRPAVRNYNVAVREWNDQIIFLRKIVPGAADRSYGIQVARLAGMPREIIERAKTILAELEAGGQAIALTDPMVQEMKLDRSDPVILKKSRRVPTSSEISAAKETDGDQNGPSQLHFGF